MESDTSININRRWLIIGAVALVIVLGIVSVVAIINGRNSGSSSETVQEDGGIEASDVGTYVTFGNRYQLEYSIGQAVASKILTQVSEFILENNVGLPGEVVAEIVETSFRKVNTGTKDFAYSFDLNVAGKTYRAIVRCDELYGKSYYLAALKNIDEDSAYLILNVVESMQDAVAADMVTWVKSAFPVDSVILTTNVL